MGLIKKVHLQNIIIFLLACFALQGCIDKEKIEAVINEPRRKQIPLGRLGLNAFFNDERFGSVRSQVNDVTQNLKFRKLRLLLRWDDNAHPVPGLEPNFAFLDTVLSKIPRGTEILLVTTGIPSWMRDPQNWYNNNPRESFIRFWLNPLLDEISKYDIVKAIQVWNEPNDRSAIENSVMGFNSPSNYYEMLVLAKDLFEKKRIRKELINAATTAINQKSNDALEYNKRLISLGAHNLVDKWAIHFYGKQFDRVFTRGGVKDVLSRTRKAIIITESGEKGINKQLDYAERVWPFLIESLGNIELIYIYTYTEDAPAESTYGLRNLSKNPFSDLYLKLLDLNS